MRKTTNNLLEKVRRKLMPHRQSPDAIIGACYRYGIAITIVLVATLLRFAFLQLLGSGFVFITFYPAVILAALYGGGRAGLLATLLSALVAGYFWIGPPGFGIVGAGNWLAMAVFLLSCTMISGITEVMQRAQARAMEADATASVAAELERAVAATRLSEQRLKLFLDSAPAAIAVFDNRMCYLSASKRWRHDFQLTGDVIGVSHYAIFPEISEHWKQVHQRCLAGAIERCEEDRFVRADGTVNWLKWEVHPWRVGSEEIGGIIILSEDITEPKLSKEELRASHEQLRALTARLQAVREEERTHVAREIHDVLAQELTGLKLELAWLSRRLAEPGGISNRPVLQEKVVAMMELTDKASRSVQRIAADLRPLVLDNLGLCAATKWVAADFQKRTEIRSEAKVPGQDLALGRDHSIALFRILQESLTNVVRHAMATKVEIHLWQAASEVILTVSDNGRGIQPQKLKHPQSLGLLGMSERATLLRGHCTISPRDGGGTTVEVRLPILSVVNPHNGS